MPLYACISCIARWLQGPVASGMLISSEAVAAIKPPQGQGQFYVVVAITALRAFTVHRVGLVGLRPS